MVSETFGIGAIAVALIGLLTKVWMDSSRNTGKVIDVVGKNAKAMTGLKDAVKENTNVTKEVRILFRNGKIKK